MVGKGGDTGAASPNGRRRRPGIRRLVREANPLVWPLGAVVTASDAVRSVLPSPRVPHAHARLHVETGRSLDAIMEWVARAQDSTGVGGIAAYYALYGGFGPAYPETTGYLVPTMLDYAAHSSKPAFEERAVRAAEWLLGLQFDEGGFPGGFARPSDGPSVFNSGQILFGLLAAHRRTGEQRFLDAAQRTGAWLGAVQDPDGAWRRHTYESVAHVYYTMVAWSLSLLHDEVGDPEIRRTAERNLDWAASRRRENGWFDGVNLGSRPVFLHFIAYTLQGMVEGGLRLGRDDLVEAARGPAERLFHRFEVRKSLPGAFTPDWEPDASAACLTGNAQIALVWERLAEVTGDLRLLNAALKMNELLKGSIAYRGPRGIRGAVKGSDPVWGAYLPLRYPNWAAKFTADSLLEEIRALRQLRGSEAAPCG